LRAGKATFSAYDSVGDMLAKDPRLSAASNPVFERIDTPGIGPHIAAGPALRATGMERSATSPAALLGTHTDEVLHEVLGLDGAAIGRLHDAGVVAGPDADPSVG
jgi:2-methylfumaryl-CoA isomerase